MKKMYILYDGRACAGDSDEASVLVACDSNEEAKSYKGEYGQMACFSYDISGKDLINEQHEWNYYPKTGFSFITEEG